jgi:glycosyltransferase involved in cell wall biosynthesis
MRILYVATDQIVPGTVGGSTHVMAVARGLADRGHEMHVLTRARDSAPFPDGPVHWHALDPPLGLRQLRFLRASQVRQHAEWIRPDVIMERYYNFGGEGALAARALRIPLVLEVNAPIVDYRGSPKQWVDRALMIEPMRRWREWQCRAASLVVTPSGSIVPAFLPAGRILELEWGADTVRFHPGAGGPLPFARPAGAVLAVFAGAFRRWHGAIHLVDAIRQLRRRGRDDITAVLIGGGPELARVQRAASSLSGVVFTGAVPHEQMPALLAAADIGVAPFDVDAHAPLALEFYWSPLKLFEYMASGLPVVAPDIPRLRRIVTDRRQGILYDATDPGALASALERLADDGAERAALGAAARERAVREFGWDVHCARLGAGLRKVSSPCAS